MWLILDCPSYQCIGTLQCTVSPLFFSLLIVSDAMLYLVWNRYFEHNSNFRFWTNFRFCSLIFVEIKDYHFWTHFRFFDAFSIFWRIFVFFVNFWSNCRFPVGLLNCRLLSVIWILAKFLIFHILCFTN